MKRRQKERNGDRASECMCVSACVSNCTCWGSGETEVGWKPRGAALETAEFHQKSVNKLCD